MMSVLRAVRNRVLSWTFSWRKGVHVEGPLRVLGRPRIHLRNGGRLFLGRDVRLWSDPVEYHGPMYAPVTILADKPGAEVHVARGSRLVGCHIHAWRRVLIGEYCLIAANTVIMDSHGHSTQDADALRRHLTQDEPEEIVVGDHVWIGLNSIITKGVRIGRGSIVAAGSVVTRDVQPFTLVGGCPAREIRKLAEAALPERAGGGAASACERLGR